MKIKKCWMYDCDYDEDYDHMFCPSCKKEINLKKHKIDIFDGDDEFEIKCKCKAKLKIEIKNTLKITVFKEMELNNDTTLEDDTAGDT